MNKVHNILVVTLITSFSLFVFSCASNKTVANKDLRALSANKLIREVEDNNFTYNEFQTKFSAKVKTEDANLSLKGQLRMKNDSIVWLSVALPVGLEVVRAMITHDSVFVINRTEKTYIKESIKNFKQFPPPIADLKFIQAILVGNDITLKNGDKYHSEIVDELYKLQTINEINKMLYVQPENFRIRKCDLQEISENGRKLELNYENFERFDDKYLPTNINLSISEKPEFNISISYSNVLINTEQDYKFSVPKKYDRVK